MRIKEYLGHTVFYSLKSTTAITYFGSRMVTGTPAHAASEKHIATRWSS